MIDFLINGICTINFPHIRNVKLSSSTSSSLCDFLNKKKGLAISAQKNNQCIFLTILASASSGDTNFNKNSSFVSDY